MSYTSIDWTKSALIIIDMQFDFVDPEGASPINGTAAIVPELSKLADLFRIHKLPVVHVIRLYHEDGHNADNCRRQAIEEGNKIAAVNSSGADIIYGLLPGTSFQLNHVELLLGKIISFGDWDHILYKPRWGAFYNTSLNKFLRQQDVNSVIIAGCNFPNCPRTTIYEASERDFRIAIVEGTISGIYDKGISELNGIGVNLLSLEEIAYQLNHAKKSD